MSSRSRLFGRALLWPTCSLCPLRQCDRLDQPPPQTLVLGRDPCRAAMRLLAATAVLSLVWGLKQTFLIHPTNRVKEPLYALLFLHLPLGMVLVLLWPMPRPRVCRSSYLGRCFGVSGEPFFTVYISGARKPCRLCRTRSCRI